MTTHLGSQSEAFTSKSRPPRSAEWSASTTQSHWWPCINRRHRPLQWTIHLPAAVCVAGVRALLGATDEAEWWRLPDLKIGYQKGASIAYIQPLTIHGRHWLRDHVKYPYSGLNAIVDAKQLLVIRRMNVDELAIHWQS